MLALVTQADGTSRGQPWVTTLLALVLVGGFVSAQIGESAARRDALDAQIADLVVSWDENPFLELDPRLVELAGGPLAVAERRDEWLAGRRARGLSVMPERIKRRTQSRFDERVADTFAGVADLPAWRHGVVDGDSPPANWFAHFAFPETPAALAVGLFFVLCLGGALEGVWGALLFAPFAAVSIGLGGFLYAKLHASLGTPWVGASGLTAALLGAYCVQAIRWPARILGAFPMPAWLMPLVWMGLELFVVRGVRSPSLEGVPVTAPAVLITVGIAAGLAARAAGVENKLKARDEAAAEVMANPVLDRAMAAHEKGRSDEAFELLRAEAERHPNHRDLAIALWTVATALGRNAEVVPALVGVIRDDLKRRRNEEAVAHWKELAPALGATVLEPTLLVRLGEVLLDAGEPGEAVAALTLAVDGGRPVPSPLAIRAVRVARDLDPALTARAAARALEDPQLDPAHREEFESLSSDITTGLMAPPPAAAEPEDVPTEVDLGDAAAPADAPTPVQTEQTEAQPETGAQPESGAQTAESLDPGALSLDQLSEDLSQGLNEEGASAGDDALARWNDPSLVEDLSGELPDDAPSLDTAYDPTAYGSVDLGAEDDITQPEVPAPTEVDALDAEADTGGVDDLDLDPTRTRKLRLLEASPLSLDDEALKLEVDGRGKTTLPYDRIDGLAVSTVEGLSGRPVLVLDLLMNWISMDGEPLKAIRLRSDRFDPRKLVADSGSAMDALKAFLATLQERSGATPLPDADAVRGNPFARHADLDTYHREVLMVDGLEG